MAALLYTLVSLSSPPGLWFTAHLHGQNPPVPVSPAWQKGGADWIRVADQRYPGQYRGWIHLPACRNGTWESPTAACISGIIKGFWLGPVHSSHESTPFFKICPLFSLSGAGTPEPGRKRAASLVFCLPLFHQRAPRVRVLKVVGGGVKLWSFLLLASVPAPKTRLWSVVAYGSAGTVTTLELWLLTQKGVSVFLWTPPSDGLIGG